MAADRWGCGWYRCAVPAHALINQGYEVMLDENWHDEILEECNVIVFQRQWQTSVYEKILKANAKGIRTVYELDDNMWNFSPQNKARKFWQEPEHIKGLESCLSACQVVTTTTNYLANIISKFNSNVVVLPNMLPLEFWIAKNESNPENRLVMGWQGSSGHFGDLELLRGIVEQMLEDYENLDVELVGMSQYPFKEHPRIKALQTVKPHELAGLIVGFDIALAPLADNLFNRSKSDLKFLEYAILGIPCVASKVLSYEETIEHGKTGFLVRNSKDWIKYLKRLIGDKDLRIEMGRKAKEYALTRTIDKNIWMWEKVYGFFLHSSS